MENDRLIYIPSFQIKEAVAKQNLRVPRPQECKAADFLNTFASGVSMVGAYLTLCSANQAIPTQEEYIASSLKFHEDAARALSKEQLDAMKARLARAYNTYVAEHSLLSLCTESGKFDDCYKTEALNTHSSVDLVVKLNETSNPIGFAIHISTTEARKWQPIKDDRQKTRGKRWQWPLLHIWAEFWRMEKVGNIHLFWYFYGANLVLGTIRQRGLRGNPEFKEFNARFLLAARCYIPKVALNLLRECREDIFYEGFDYAQYKWAKFVEIPKKGTCLVCGSTDWWWRPASGLGGPGGWLCGKCHPNPNPVSKEVEVSNDKGHCKHGEFLLREGCPQCMAERRQQGEPANTHRPYHLADGAIIPSVTTILSVLDKPGLPHWAWECGRQDLDYREIRDAAGRVGTVAHYLIACHLKGEKADYLIPPDEADKAEKCLEKYLAWERDNPLSPVMIETPLISEEYKYGGTPDLLAELNGEFVLIDFKTGGGIYDSYLCQLAAYRKLLEEQGWPVASARILRISADDSDFEEVVKTNLDVEWQIFQHCLEIYRLQGSRQCPEK